MRFPLISSKACVVSNRYTTITGLTITGALYVALVYSSAIAFALDSDRGQMLKIQADTAELDENKGTAIYRGSVELSQGSLLITAHTLTIYNSEEGVSKVVAKGGPAKYTQTIDEEEEPVHAHAIEITYFPAAEKLVLSKSAKLTQGGSRFEGETIDYDIQKQILTADGGAKSVDGTTNPKNKATGRVKMLLPPANRTATLPE